MEDYYIKYAKPLDDLSITQVQSQLKSWEKNTKGEIDLLIFIMNGIKNESMNCLSPSTKVNILSVLDQLKAFCFNVLDNLCELLRAIAMNRIFEVNHQLYADIELIRKDYNIQLKNNQKAISSNEVLIDLKEKYHKMKKVLNEPGDECFDQLEMDYNTNNNMSSNYKMNKLSSKARIPKLDFNMIEDMSKQNVNEFVYKKMSFSSQKENEASKECSNNNHRDSANNASMNTITTSRPISQRDKYPSKYTKTQSYDNVFDAPNCNTKNHKRLNVQPLSSLKIDSYRKMQNEIKILQDEIQKLKGKKSKQNQLKIPQNTLNDEYVLKLQNQNNQMWNEMSKMRKDICELSNTVRGLTQKINEITEDNHRINQHNEKLTQYIKDLTQNNLKCNNNYSNHTTIKSNHNDYNNTCGVAYNKYKNDPKNRLDDIIYSSPIPIPIDDSNSDLKYNCEYNSGCDSNIEYLNENENEISHD